MAPDNTGWGEWGRYVLEELKRLNLCLIEVSKDLSAVRKERDAKVGKLEDELEERLREAEKEIERLKERLKVVSIVQVAFTSITSAIAGWLGMRG